MERWKERFLAALVVGLIGVTPHHGVWAKTLFGAKQKLGSGTVRTYAVVRDDGTPTAIGIAFKASALQGLPSELNTKGRCFDLNKNGRIDAHGECEGDYEQRLSLPAQLSENKDIPFRWVGLNWNSHGHPPKAWSVPHFDFHFYMIDRKAVDAIRVGGCEFFINCEDQKRALIKVPAKYVNPQHISVKATVSMMGDHLIDSKAAELAPKNPKPFTHTWIFGAYDGHITFYEPMITRAYFLSHPNGCTRIKQPKAWEKAGYYPRVYCMRYSEKHKSYTVSLEGLKLRKAN